MYVYIYICIHAYVYIICITCISNGVLLTCVRWYLLLAKNISCQRCGVSISCPVKASWHPGTEGSCLVLPSVKMQLRGTCVGATNHNVAIIAIWEYKVQACMYVCTCIYLSIYIIVYIYI